MEILMENLSSIKICCTLIGENDFKDRLEIRPKESHIFGNLKISQSYLLKFSKTWIEDVNIIYKIKAPCSLLIEEDMSIYYKNPKIKANSYSFPYEINSLIKIEDQQFTDISSNQEDSKDYILPTKFYDFENKIIQNQPEGLEICNRSNIKIFLRISGQFCGSEEWLELNKGEALIVQRYANIYHLEFAQLPQNNFGPTLYVDTREIYTIHKDFTVKDKNKKIVEFSTEHFLTKYRNEELFFSRNKEVTDLKDLKNPKKICIINESQVNAKIRIKKFNLGSEDYFNIEPKKFAYFEREKGKFLLEYYIDDKIGARRYIVKINKVYVIKDEYTFVDSKNKKLPITEKTFDTFLFDGLIFESKTLIQKSNLHQDEKNDNEEKKYCLKVKSFYTFDVNLILINQNGEEINQECTPSHAINFISFKGPHYLIKIGKKKSHKYLVNCPGDYYIDSSFKLYNNKAKIQIVPTNDNSLIKTLKEIEDKIEEIKLDVKDEKEDNEEEIIPYYQNKSPNITGHNFIDIDFPPETRILNSLDANGNKIKSPFAHCDEEEKYNDSFKFRRLQDIFKIDDENFLFKDRIDLEDATQNKLGNCYFVSSICGLARRPDLIQNIFKTKSINPFGLYEIYFYSEGNKQIIFIDDFFPIDSWNGTILGSKPNGKEAWILILEKSYAKFQGGYSNTYGGSPIDVLIFFTGCITKEYKPENSWNDICFGIKKNHILVCGTKIMPIEESKGLVSPHAYTILDAKEYSSVDKNGNVTNIKLIKLRNPHGFNEWKGDYSDDSPLWTDELTEFFCSEDAFGDNGIFYILYEDFVKYFISVFICYC